MIFPAITQEKKKESLQIFQQQKQILPQFLPSEGLNTS